MDPAGESAINLRCTSPSGFWRRFVTLKHKTIFTRWGYLFPYACFFLIMGKLIWMLAGKRRRRYQS